MRSAIVLLFAVSLSVAAPVPKALKAKTDAELLEGRWVRESIDDGSGPKPDASRWVEVKDGQMTAGDSAGQEQVIRATFTLDATQSPKQINVSWSHFGTTMSYIYKLDGDTLTWCHAQDNQPRPTDFKGGGGRYCIVYKRVKE